MLLKRILSAVLLAGVPAMAVAQMNALPAQPHLLVKGQGHRTVMPDRFTVTLSLQSTDMDADAARRKVQTNAAQVIDAFKQSHVVKDSLHASSLGISPSFEYREGRQEYKGNQVTRQIRGSFANLRDMQEFLAATPAGPELQIASLSPGYADEAALRAKLKREAAEQTRRTAAKLAEAYGARITGLYSISDVAPDFAYGIQAGTWPSGPVEVAEPRPADVHASPAPPTAVADSGARVGQPESLETGTLTFTENVYAIFLIDP